MALRVLFLADTHLGFDLPSRPRVARRRRGPDFFSMFERALAPARAGKADLVVHGGDLLFRSRVPASLVQKALAPLREVADRGITVFLVPGNHERSRIPFPLLACHPRIHVFHGPRTVAGEFQGLRVAISGFPFARRIRGRLFDSLLERTGWRRHEADVRLLCLHQAVEGATVGVQDFTFRRGDDVVAAADVPAGFAAVLSGHVHRAQILREGLSSPVLYPGSVERTSFAERREAKGYLRLRFEPGRLAAARFVSLPTRPMVVIEVDARGRSEADLVAALERPLDACAADAVVRIDVHGVGSGGALGAARLRALAPRTMNVSMRYVDAPR